VTPPLVFVSDVLDPVLDAGDEHHLRRVLRVRPGDELLVADGAGRWRACRLGAGGRPEPAGDVQVEVRPEPAVTIAFAVTKGERPELAVQKLTELGVDRIVPFAAERSVVRWDPERAARHTERLRRVAREAAMQCRRPYLPVVDDLADFTSVASLPGAVLADRGGGPPSLANPTVLVGPEGGWSEAERSAGMASVTLGPHVLRAETAAMAAAFALVALRHRVVTEGGHC
jgi:16S rRNA (uracil1498-N3)-methyltransferase